jgi:hypothetical protein
VGPELSLSPSPSRTQPTHPTPGSHPSH